MLSLLNTTFTNAVRKGFTLVGSLLSKLRSRSAYFENKNCTKATLQDLDDVNLLDKASIVTTPTAYNDGKLHSVKPVQTLGDEEVTNGDFENGSANWSYVGVSPTFVNSTAVLENNARMYQGNVATLSENYKVVINFSEISGNGITVYYGGGSASVLYTVQSIIDNGYKIEETTKFSNNTSIYIYSSNADTYAVIDNVSVKEVIDADFDFQRGSAATRVNSQGLIENVQTLSGNLVQNGDFSEIGSELVVNGDFATDSDWSKVGNVTIQNGVASFVDNGTNANSYVQQNVLTANRTYIVTFEVTRYVNGKIQILSGSNALDIASVGVGTYKLQVESGSGTILRIKRWGSYPNYDFDIDNVSVKEVGQNWAITDSDANNYVEFGDGTARLKFLNTFPITSFTSDTALFQGGKKYKLTVDVANVTSGSIKIDGSGISELFNTVGVSTRIINPSSNGAIYFYRATANVDVTLNSVSLIEITDDTDLPRIDYTDGCGSLLLEPQSTNRIIYSEDLSNMQIAFGGAISLDSSFTNPSGQNGSYFIYDTDGGSEARFRVSNSGFTLGDKLSYSVFIKSDSSSSITIGGNYGGENCTFNVGEKTLISQGSSVDSYEIINFTNGWTKYVVNTTFTDTVGNGSSYPFFTTNATLSEKIYVWGHQLEQSSYATSYIPTNGSTATRLADVCNNAGSSDLINSTEGVLYVEVAAFVTASGSDMNIQLNDGVINNNSINIVYQNSSDVLFQKYANGVKTTTFNISSIVKTDFNKIAIRYNATQVNVFLNGVNILNNADTNAFSIPLNNLSFNRANNTKQFQGKVKSVAVFKEALTNDELEGLTGEGYDTFNALALANNYTII